MPIRYWTGWGGDWSGKTWEAMIATDTLKEMFCENQVEIKGAVPYEAFLTAIAAGEPPDGASNIQYIDYMARDVLLPLEDYVATSTIIKKDDFVEGNWNQGFFKGVQLGVPAIECFLQYGLDYNAKMVEEAGLDPASPPVTWDDVFAWNEKLTKYDSAGNLLTVGLDPYDAMAGGLWDTSAFFVPLSWGWYAERLGLPENMGIISAAFFRERVPRAVPIGVEESEGRSQDRSDRAGRVKSETSRPQPAPAPSAAGAAQSQEDEYAATGIGRRTDHPVQYVQVDLEDHPAATIDLRYEFRPQLVRLGVLPAAPDPDALTRRHRARGFEPGFCPEPRR